MGRAPDFVHQVGRGGAPKRKPDLIFAPRFSGSKNAIADNVLSTRKVVQAYRCMSFESADTAEQMDSLWSARKQALWASLAVRPEGTRIWSTDVAVPLSRMGELIGWLRLRCAPGQADSQGQRRVEKGRRDWACLRASWATSATETFTR